MATKETKKVEEKQEEKKEFKLTQVYALWKKTSKAGGTYFEGNGVTGFFNTKKKNPKEPDLRIYTKDEKGNLSEKPVLSLWCNVGKNDNKYLTGMLDSKRVVGFISKDKEDSKKPYVAIYYSEDQVKTEEGKQETKESANVEHVKPEDLF